MKRTKIVATIGPASENKEIIKSLVENGADVFRLNFSHRKYEETAKTIKTIRSVESELKKPIAILGDLQGPKIRVGEIDGKIILNEGETVKIAPTQEDEKTIPMAEFIIKNLQKGDEVFITDGIIKLEVAKIQKTNKKIEVFCKVIAAGEVTSHKGVNLPGVKIDIDPLTAKDKKDLEFCLASDIDFIALSFVKSAKDVEAVRNIINKKKSLAKIVAKIETPEAVADLDAIINASDAVMVARGDLGIEISLENISRVQKEIIRKCNFNAKPVITATQMLGSMVKNSLPTRAEVSDVSNAVLDGTDAVMLSEETAMGRFPVEAVRMMQKIINEAEKIFHYGKNPPHSKEFAISDAVTLVIGDGITHIAGNIDIKAVVAFTESGRTARVISAFRPYQTILAVSPNIKVQRNLSLNWGISPIMAATPKSTDQLIKQAKELALKSGIIKKGDKIIISAGIPFGKIGSTNLILVQEV